MDQAEAKPNVIGCYDPATGTVSYIASDPASGRAAVIDPVLDFDPKSGRTSTRSADAVVAAAQQHHLSIDWILETHVHADHLSGMPYVKRRLGGRSGIGERVAEVQRLFCEVFNFERDFHADGRQFDHLFQDGETFQLGTIPARVLHTPGHTPACVCYLIGDAIFVGDTLFMPDSGTARCDFPGGSAATLYRSIRRILDLPPQTRMFICHDYCPGGRPAAWETTVAEQRTHNIHVHDGVSETDFVALRTGRDKTLGMPVLMIPSVQVNIRAGEFPEERNGVRYLRVPVDVL